MASDNAYYANLTCPYKVDKPRITIFDNGGTVRAQCHLCGYNSITLNSAAWQMTGRDIGKSWWNGLTHYCLRGRITNVQWLDG